MWRRVQRMFLCALSSQDAALRQCVFGPECAVIQRLLAEFATHDLERDGFQAPGTRKVRPAYMGHLVQLAVTLSELPEEQILACIEVAPPLVAVATEPEPEPEPEPAPDAEAEPESQPEPDADAEATDKARLSPPPVTDEGEEEEPVAVRKPIDCPARKTAFSHRGSHTLGGGAGDAGGADGGGGVGAVERGVA